MSTKLHLTTTSTIVALLLGALCLPAFADVRASVSNSKLALGDTFELHLQADGQQTNAAPDLAPLAEDFDILGTSQSSSTSMVNGVASSAHGWAITLAPTAEGTYTIPAIDIGGESSQPLTVEVIDAASLPQSNTNNSAALQVEMTAPAGPFYVQQEIPVTVRIIDAAGLRSAELSEPASPDAVVTKSGEDQTSQVTQGQQSATIIEQTYRVKPSKSGKLTLAPLTLRGRVNNPQARRSALAEHFDSFGLSGQFAGSGFGSGLFDEVMNPGQPVTVRSAPLVLDIQARPAQADGWFLPAKKVELQANWTPEKPQFRVGEAVNRTVQIAALGASEEQLPDLVFDAIDGARVYVDRTDKQSADTAEGTVAIKQFSLSIVPTRPGPVTLPLMEVTWWDTQADKQKTTTLPAETFDVEGDVGLAAQTGAAPAVTPTEKSAITPRVEPQPPQTNKVRLWVSSALMALLLAALALFTVVRRRKTLVDRKALSAAAGAPLPPGVASVELTSLERNLRTACKAGDAQLAYGSLRRWLAISRNQLPTTLAAGNARPVTLEAFLAELEQALYSDQSAERWRGKELLAAFDEFKAGKATKSKRRKRVVSIPPLYPIDAL